MNEALAVVKRRENVLALPGEVTRTALVLPADLSEPDWQTVGGQLVEAESGVMWWIGDWWAFGDKQKYGERKAFAEVLRTRGGFTFETCMKAAVVCRAIETFRRRKDLNTRATGYGSGHNLTGTKETQAKAERHKWRTIRPEREAGTADGCAR